MTALCGALFIIIGIFPVNPGLGYPPDVAPTYRLAGLIHAIAVTIFFGCLCALCFVLARYHRAGDPAWKGWAPYSRITGVLAPLGYVAASALTTLDMYGILPNAPGGLVQRIAIISGFGWIMLLALRLLRQQPSAEPAHTERSELSPAARNPR